MRFRGRAAATLLVGLFWCAQAGAGDRALVLPRASVGARRALVIGNQAYALGALDNPRKDAGDVARHLEALGFKVALKTDVSFKDLARAVDEYSETLQSGDVSFIFYSGHGMSVGGENYLVPVDFAGTKEADVPYLAYALDRLVKRVDEHSPSLSVLVLDACRNNPFLKTRGGGGGLAGVNAARGTLIQFATAPGETAADGVRGENGTYTGALLRHLAEPDIDVEAAFKRVREDVSNSTSGRQVPWSTSSVVGTFCLAGTSCGSGSTSGTPPPAPPVTATLPVVKTRTRSDKKSGLVLVEVPGGALHVGCEPHDLDCYPDEKPGTDTRVKTFWLSQTEVTAGEYAKCMEAGKCPQAGTGAKCTGGVAGAESQPINCVTWDQARAFCTWIGGRLPTAAEWELAAKAGGGHVYPWGAQTPSPQHARYYPSDHPVPVATLPAGTSPLGIADLAGNVREWTASDYDGSKEVRGGGFTSFGKLLRASARQKVAASDQHNDLGFRCAR